MVRLDFETKEIYVKPAGKTGSRRFVLKGAEPMKARHAELCSELIQVETEIRELDPSWKPASLRPKIDDKIRELLVAGPMAVESIIAAVGGSTPLAPHFHL